jgi:hypothetical protein
MTGKDQLTRPKVRFLARSGVPSADSRGCPGHPLPDCRATLPDQSRRFWLGRPGARCRDCSRSVPPRRPPNPACEFPAPGSPRFLSLGVLRWDPGVGDRVTTVRYRVTGTVARFSTRSRPPPAGATARWEVMSQRRTCQDLTPHDYALAARLAACLNARTFASDSSPTTSATDRKLSSSP